MSEIDVNDWHANTEYVDCCSTDAVSSDPFHIRRRIAEVRLDRRWRIMAIHRCSDVLSYKDIAWFWQLVRDMSPAERSMLLMFVCGRSR